MSPVAYHITYDLTDRRRVFITGDIHGEFLELEKGLAAVNFDSNHDVLVTPGDLIDRGPQCHSVFSWIDKDWFLYSLGNHELFLGMYARREVTTEQVSKWGGTWFLEYSLQELENIASILECAPYAMTILTPGGRRIGVVHADCLSDWNNHIESLDYQWCRDMSIGARHTIKALMKSQKKGEPYNVAMAAVSNIDHVFHGHTVLGRPFTIANRTWIDTGLCFGGDLTLFDVDEFLLRRGE